MIPFGTHIAAAAIAGVLAFGAAWQVQGMRYGEQIADLKREHTDAALSSARNALKLTEHYRENADAAVRKAEARAAQNKRDADSLRAELDWLRGDLADVPDRIRNASREAVDQYAAAATVVFGECAARYSELAISATGHASDVKTLMDAWPTTTKAPPEHPMTTLKIDNFAQAAMAEIERREGYEGELLTALENCRKPVKALDSKGR